ncbi:hypothetical protein J0A67_04760 [Algoriphagus aestuariicola]|uniref:DUF4469 domain-containing protein n=1 Tax=Algoriphagus aestuariicola TaxID=1852016 RepID=A0ABS3BR42_9BACT|nr:hypothetical protein [Algoriphagus aestuariicola]MBN7800159.1 hypothetical protein [Algoriphagus aestuariicola]
MAKQAGYIKLEGTIGDLSFYKNRDGNFIARRKGGVTKKRLLTDPKFQRTRENMQEFSRAATAAKFLKNAFREIEIKSNGGRLHNRLYSQSMKVIKSDPTSARGERKFELGDMSILRGFQFSEKAVFDQVFKKQLTIVDDPASVTVTVPEMVPSKYLVYAQGTTHYRFSLIRAAVNAVDGTFYTEINASENLVVNSQTHPELVLTLPKPAIAGENYFFAVSLEFLMEVNGGQYDSFDVSMNPAVILAVV